MVLTSVSLISRALPQAEIAVVVKEAEPSLADEENLMPQELEVTRAAVDRRRAEFATSRLLVREGLRELGISHSGPILPAPDRSPIWPAGVSGSITHTESYCAVALARAPVWIGIDAELCGRVSDGVWQRITTPAEQDVADAAGLAPRLIRALVFSAKEAIYKAQYPETTTFLDFAAVEVRRLAPESTEEGTVQLRFTQAVGKLIANGETFVGRYATDGRVVMTAFVIAR